MNTNQHNSDIELIESYLAGDESALNLLVGRWHLEFCKKAYWFVKDADLSKDIAQDSWRVIIQKLHTLENHSSFKSWAFRIVYTKSMDVLRHQKRKRSKEFELKKEQNAFFEEGENDNLNLQDKLLKAIQQLPQNQQLVIRLFYTQEYSLKDIGEILDISVGTAKSRLFHARERLKLILKEQINK